MSEIVSHLVSMNDNVLAAFDVETTGYEVCQVGLVLLDCNFEPYRHLYTEVRPEFEDEINPQAMQIHKIPLAKLRNSPSRNQVCVALAEFKESIGLAPGKRMTPLVHNGVYDIPFMQKMLGLPLYDDLFGYPVRDTQSVIAGIIDKAAWRGVPCMFKRAGLKHVCEILNITFEHHDALSDALATGQIYRRLMDMEW